MESLTIAGVVYSVRVAESFEWHLVNVEHTLHMAICVIHSPLAQPTLHWGASTVSCGVPAMGKSEKKRTSGRHPKGSRTRAAGYIGESGWAKSRATFDVALVEQDFADAMKVREAHICSVRAVSFSCPY